LEALHTGVTMRRFLFIQQVQVVLLVLPRRMFGRTPTMEEMVFDWSDLVDTSIIGISNP